MPYIEAVLLECQRYYPVVPVIGPRRALKTTSLAEYIIPRVSFDLEGTTKHKNVISGHYSTDQFTCRV